MRSRNIETLERSVRRQRALNWIALILSSIAFIDALILWVSK